MRQLDSLVACGPGVERIAEEVARAFPGQAHASCSRATFPAAPSGCGTELAAIAAGEFDIVIGTQLVAKGHNFPLMTLVGVLDADIGLDLGDPRAAERTFQLLQQVTGRAGRGEKPGRGLVQTWQPDHPVIAALVSGDAERFYEEETRVREMARPAALRAPGRPHRLGGREREAAEGPCPRHGARAPSRRPASRCSARPRRRSR